MDEQAVLARFQLLSGLTAEQSADWLPLCKQAVTQINASLKPGVDAAAHSEELCMAAACLVFYQYAIIQDVLRDESFAAGEVKVTQKIKPASAEQVWQQAKAAVASLLTDSDFMFRRVPS